ncbi:hypothetical protein ABW19_dt0206136 [Dactylella cylindrospora]|nr:hypothetical protein ABW19_dt0206136 [Dactylella cylindrospora]
MHDIFRRGKTWTVGYLVGRNWWPAASQKRSCLSVLFCSALKCLLFWSFRCSRLSLITGQRTQAWTNHQSHQPKLMHCQQITRWFFSLLLSFSFSLVLWPPE